MKNFLIIGNMNAFMYRGVFPLIREGKIRYGYDYVNTFIQNREEVKFGNICWYTTLGVNNVREELPLTKKYSVKDYSMYDNYDAINVDRLSDIPMDYNGFIGVPITYLNKHNPKQFKIVGIACGNSRKNKFNYEVPYKKLSKDRGGCPVIKGKLIYARLFIQKV